MVLKRVWEKSQSLANSAREEAANKYIIKGKPLEKCTCSLVQRIFCKCEEITSFFLCQKSKLLFVMIVIFWRRVDKEWTLCLGFHTVTMGHNICCARITGLGAIVNKKCERELTQYSGPYSRASTKQPRQA